MVIVQEQRTQIKDIIKKMDCPKDFVCYKSNFENIGEVGIVGNARMIECIEKNVQTCQFGFSFCLGTICKCPLRNYIAKNFYR